MINTYILYIIIFTITGFVSYGLLPIFFSYVNLTNLITPLDEKKLKEKNKLKEFEEDNDHYYLETEALKLDNNKDQLFTNDNEF